MCECVGSQLLETTHLRNGCGRALEVGLEYILTRVEIANLNLVVRVEEKGRLRWYCITFGIAGNECGFDSRWASRGGLKR